MREDSFQATPKNTRPVISSTKGYWMEILPLQPRHRPFWTKKLNSGRSSNQLKVLPQDKHFERPLSPCAPCRRTITFRKLPTIVPSAKKNRRIIVVMALFRLARRRTIRVLIPLLLYHAKTAPTYAGAVFEVTVLIIHVVGPWVSCISATELCSAAPSSRVCVRIGGIKGSLSHCLLHGRPQMILSWASERVPRELVS